MIKINENTFFKITYLELLFWIKEEILQNNKITCKNNYWQSTCIVRKNSKFSKYIVETVKHGFETPNECDRKRINDGMWFKSQ